MWTNAHGKLKKKIKKKTFFFFYIKCTDIKELKAIRVLKTVIKLFCLFQAHIDFFFCSQEPESKGPIKNKKIKNAKQN